MVRQVFSHRVFRPLEGGTSDEEQIAVGLVAAEHVLIVLDSIANEGLVLNSEQFTLADCYLAPMRGGKHFCGIQL